VLRHRRGDMSLDPSLLARALAGPAGPLQLADGAAAQGLRPAAVLCGIIPRSAGAQVQLIRRAGALRQHAGQIAFPGGKIDADDPSPLHAALREAREEVGLDPAQARVLGGLPPYATRTGFAIHPFVAVLPAEFVARPCPHEVAEAFEAPLDWLTDPARCRRLSRDVGGVARGYWAIEWGDRFIWGATAAILRSLSLRLQAARAAQEQGAAPETA
ncbi:MAG: CoA pyrophosphatase, partial [Rubrimonas sp.]